MNGMRGGRETNFCPLCLRYKRPRRRNPSASRKFGNSPENSSCRNAGNKSIARSGGVLQWRHFTVLSLSSKGAAYVRAGRAVSSHGESQKSSAAIVCRSEARSPQQYAVSQAAVRAIRRIEHRFWNILSKDWWSRNNTAAWLKGFESNPFAEYFLCCGLA